MVVLDTSAVLAVLLDERGAEVVIPQMRGAHISIINICEVLTKSIEQGGQLEAAKAMLDGFELRVRSFRDAHAMEVARLRPLTRGLGLGDRACLAQALFSDMPVLTADRHWAGLDIGVDIRLIR